MGLEGAMGAFGRSTYFRTFHCDCTFCTFLVYVRLRAGETGLSMDGVMGAFGRSVGSPVELRIVRRMGSAGGEGSGDGRYIEMTKQLTPVEAAPVL